MSKFNWTEKNTAELFRRIKTQFPIDAFIEPINTTNSIALQFEKLYPDQTICRKSLHKVINVHFYLGGTIDKSRDDFDKVILNFGDLDLNEYTKYYPEYNPGHFHNFVFNKHNNPAVELLTDLIVPLNLFSMYLKMDFHIPELELLNIKYATTPYSSSTGICIFVNKTYFHNIFADKKFIETCKLMFTT